MKRILPAIALIAGLSLVGCTGGGDKPDQADGGGESPAAEAQPEAKKLDEAQLKEILESTQVDGQSFEAVDGAGNASSEATKALESSEFEPAKCKDITMNLLNANLAAKGTTVAGTSSDNILSAALSSYDDMDGAQTQIEGASKIAEECSDVKIKTAGVEMSMKYKTFDAKVDGADETSGIVASVEAGGQTAMNLRMVYALVDNNVVAVSNIADVEEATVTNAADALVESVKNAG
ncbi:hypothetical protein A2T55_05605 [Brevibacterium linens]|uniref:PknH-like extracellular domain-containing protein n=1 Tax=Brevibacterium linens TaxID=1703 RepID=A0A142NLQ8_BRELN|nr:hypothetical protein [Brevibacterium linens]AMT93320.1 hypothetical protein A2T55_05605 [Brevibacterium linens]